MSIIHEALRKAELEKARPPVLEREPLPVDRIFEPVREIPQPKKEEKRTRYYEEPAQKPQSLMPMVLLTAGVVFFLALCVSLFLLFRGAGSKAAPVSAPAVQQQPSRPAPEIRKPELTVRQTPSEIQVSTVLPETQTASVTVPPPPVPILKKSMVKYGLFTPPPKKVEYRLLGIVSTDNARTAIINNRDIELGGTIEGAKVKAINSDSVVLEKKGKEFTLSLY